MIDHWWVGSYGPLMEGTATGISLLRTRENGTLEFLEVAAETESPAFLISRDDHLYSVNEGTGSVSSFRRNELMLRHDGTAGSGGTWPCNVSLLETAIVASNYQDGVLGIVGLAPDGSVTSLLHSISSEGRGPHPRQDGPHAHSSLRVDPHTLLSLDLGTDRIYIHSLDGALEGGMVTRTGAFAVPAGTGPRDIARHPSGLFYVLGELGRQLHVLRWEHGQLGLVSSVDLPGAVGHEQAAGISFGAGGRFVYVGLRGAHRIAVLRASDDGGVLEAVGWVSSEGEWPRHHVVDGDVLHVANQYTDAVASFLLSADGMPSLIAEPTTVPSPAYLLAVS